MGGWAIAVHGGAGVDPNLPLERQEEAKRLLTRCLDLGISSLRSNHSALDVVELVVRFLSLSLSGDRSTSFFSTLPFDFHGWIHLLFISFVNNGFRLIIIHAALCGFLQKVCEIYDRIYINHIVLDNFGRSFLVLNDANKDVSIGLFVEVSKFLVFFFFLHEFVLFLLLKRSDRSVA